MQAFRIRFQYIPYSVAGLVLIYSAIILWIMTDHFKWDANLYLGLLLVPYLCKIQKGVFSSRYIIPALLAVAIALLLPVKTILVVAVLFTGLFLIENTLGKLNQAIVFLVLLISPAFNYLIRLVEFPLRLWLSGQVAGMLNFIGIKASASGNQIMLGQDEFSVDPACAGLNMLVTSLLICLFVLSFYQYQTKKYLRFLQLGCLLLVTIFLNIICNYFRILVLVAFKIMPGTFFHDFVGMACLVGYVIVPILCGMKPVLKKWGTNSMSYSQAIQYKGIYFRYPVLHFLFLLALVAVCCRISTADSMVSSSRKIQLSEFHKSELKNGIMKFENSNALIYVKPTAFYVPEHDPMICWTGSGYQFKHIKKEKLAGYEIYTATLVKGKDKIYSAWWFDNGRIKTVNQFRWRWNAARGLGQQYYLINVNTGNQLMLRKEINALLKQKF